LSAGQALGFASPLTLTWLYSKKDAKQFLRNDEKSENLRDKKKRTSSGLPVRYDRRVSHHLRPIRMGLLVISNPYLANANFGIEFQI
jgi:hypothetical protein